MKRTIATALIAGLMLPVAGLFTASQLQAQTALPIPEMMLAQRNDDFDRGERAERLIEELNLTEAQVSQIRAIREGARDEMQALHSNLRDQREVLHDLMASEATENELRAQYDTVQSRHQEVADARFENMLAVREVLTPEQRAELSELMEQRRENRRDDRGFRGDRGFRFR